ncbi:hypothetical protein APHAL10511_005303 [Amanita phalloides]|nr:hypothetical protein APHAL10511_005303 [Amanita phalloides]
MDKHALEILKTNDVWKWPNTLRYGNQVGKLERITPKLLYYLILESQKLNGTVLDRFRGQLGACDGKTEPEYRKSESGTLKSAERSFEVLFQGLDPQNVDFSPLLKMAAKYSRILASHGTDGLLEIVNQEGEFGKRKQEALKALSFKRDGESCLLADIPHNDAGITPILAHIIPDSVHGKCIAKFAGTAARDDAVHHLNKIGNVMNMQQDAHTDYNNLKWGIEAEEEGGKVKFFFRMVPRVPNRPSPVFIRLWEGDEIQFWTRAATSDTKQH